jgi:hypothetical protein
MALPARLESTWCGSNLGKRVRRYLRTGYYLGFSFTDRQLLLLAIANAVVGSLVPVVPPKARRGKKSHFLDTLNLFLGHRTRLGFSLKTT